MKTRIRSPVLLKESSNLKGILKSSFLRKVIQLFPPLPHMVLRISGEKASFCFALVDAITFGGRQSRKISHF